MKFSPVPVERAQGKILDHNVSDSVGKRVLRMGIQLINDNVRLLAENRNSYLL